MNCPSSWIFLGYDIIEKIKNMQRLTELIYNIVQ